MHAFIIMACSHFVRLRKQLLLREEPSPTIAIWVVGNQMRVAIADFDNAVWLPLCPNQR